MGGRWVDVGRIDKQWLEKCNLCGKEFSSRIHRCKKPDAVIATPLVQAEQTTISFHEDLEQLRRRLLEGIDLVKLILEKLPNREDT